MKNLRRLALEITGKEVAPVDYPDYYFIGPNHLEIPGGKGRKEQVIHEVCHWVVAQDWQREHPENLGMGHSQDDYEGKDPRCTAQYNERQEIMACHVQRAIYQFAGKPFPKGQECSCNNRNRERKGLTDEEVEWVMGRAHEVGWPTLVALARARW